LCSRAFPVTVLIALIEVGLVNCEIVDDQLFMQVTVRACLADVGAL
jgi:hypothetical protein